MATNRYDRNRLIAVLKDQTDIDPVTYDASYTLLPETVKAYRSVTDFSRVGYRDMDLLYNMVIRTGRSTLEDKKAAIRGSHLPESEQNRLIALLDEVAAKAERGEYGYRSARQPAQAGEFGMFGTCFFSFEERISEEDARDFVRMCMDVQETQEEDDCLESVNQVFSKGWKDRRIGPLSLILHCLKPDSIFPVLWSNVRRDKTAKGYIPNVKVIRERRNRMFSFRNYRVFENVSFSLGDYLLTPPEKATISLEKLDEAVASYKANFAATDAEEHYKFAAIRCWQENFQGWEEKDPSEFPDILSRATREAGNLLTRNFFYARKMIQIIAEAKPAYTRTMFRNLFAEEEEPVLNRVAQFWEDSEIFFRISGNPNLNT